MPAKREQQLKDFAKPEHKVFPEKRASLHPKKEKTLLSHLLKRAGLADNEPSEPVFPGSEIGKVQPIGEAREKTSLTPVPTQSVGSQSKQPSIVLPQSGKNMSKDQSHIAARESGAPLHTKEPTQSFSKLPDGNIAKPFSKMKQGSIDYSRNTGVADVDGEIYVNGNDVELLGKLGFEYSESDYNGLEKTSEALDLYSYIEKVAGVPKEVAKLIDAGQAFSGEYLKDMGYKLPKGYEVKGDLVCRVEKTEQSFQQTGKEKKESSEKTAAANPAQTILITGHSGAGKSTLSKQLAEKLNLPLHRVDAQTSWDDLRAHFEKNPELERKALTPGTAENKQYIKDVRKIVHRSLKEINGPAVLEGTQLTTLPAKQLAKYKANILVGGDMNQSIAQRLQRMTDKAAKKGITLSPEQLAKKREESQLVAGSWHPGMEKFRKLPGVLSYNHSEHQIDPLVEQLKQLMGKQASAASRRILDILKRATPEKIEETLKRLALLGEHNHLAKPNIVGEFAENSKLSQKLRSLDSLRFSISARFPGKNYKDKVRKTYNTKPTLERVYIPLKKYNRFDIDRLMRHGHIPRHEQNGEMVDKITMQQYRIQAKEIAARKAGLGTEGKLLAQYDINNPNIKDIKFTPHLALLEPRERDRALLANNFFSGKNSEWAVRPNYETVVNYASVAKPTKQDAGRLTPLRYFKPTQEGSPGSIPAASLPSSYEGFMYKGGDKDNIQKAKKLKEIFTMNPSETDYLSHGSFYSGIPEVSAGYAGEATHVVPVTGFRDLRRHLHPRSANREVNREINKSVSDYFSPKFEYVKQAEYKWHKSKDLHRDVTNGRHYPFSFLTGEAKELVDAIKNRDMANFKEEIGDTTYAAQMLAAQATGLNHPVYADLSKFHNREKIWKDIFKEKGSTYHPKHMEGGSNFAKPSKIIKALASAGIRISQKEAERLANKYTGGKMEKEAAAPTQHYEGEAVKPFGGVAGGMSGGVGLQGQSTVRSNQPALRPTPPQLRPMPAPEPVNPAPGSPVGVTNTSPTMSPGTGHVVSTHAPLNVNNVPLGQTKAPSWSDVYSKMKTRPSDFVPDGIAAGVGMVANRIIPGAGLSADLLNKVRRGQAMAQIGVGETSARGKKDDPTGAMIDRIGALGGAAAIYPHPYAKAIGYGVQAGAMGINLARDYDQARAQFPDTLTEQPVVPSSNYPASNFSIRPEQQAQPSINTGGDLLAKKGMQTQTYKFEGNVQGVHLRKELHNILDKMRREGLAVNHPETNEVYATLEGRKKYTDAILDKLKKVLSERKERPLAYGSDYNISHVPSMQEKLKPVKFTKEHLMAFVKRNAEIKSLQSKAEKDQFDFVGKRYRLKPNQHGELEGMVPGKAYDQLINGAPSYSFQIHPQADILGKQAASIGSLGRLGKALGVKGYGKIMDASRGAFDNFSSLGKSVPPGALHTERMNALNTGNKLLEDFKPDGFKIYSGRVKTPDSLAGHGNQVTNDMLGFRVTPKNGYGEDSANALADQLRQQGINVTKQKKLVRDGYHGWNIAGEMPGANGNVPVEFQMTPRRMQGVFAANHMYNYKPETSGVNPAVGKYIYKPVLNYLTKTMSPMSPMQTRVGYGAAGLTGVGGLGAGAYSLARPGGAAPGVTSARPMAQPNTQPIAMGSPQVNVDTL